LTHFVERTTHRIFDICTIVTADGNGDSIQVGNRAKQTGIFCLAFFYAFYLVNLRAAILLAPTVKHCDYDTNRTDRIDRRLVLRGQKFNLVQLRYNLLRLINFALHLKPPPENWANDGVRLRRQTMMIG